MATIISPVVSKRYGFTDMSGLYYEKKKRGNVVAFLRLESCWENPFKAPRDGTLVEVLAKHELYIRSRPELLERLPELAGLELTCDCIAQAHCPGELLVRLFDEFVRAPA